jgi:hypothetical protein
MFNIIDSWSGRVVCSKLSYEAACQFVESKDPDWVLYDMVEVEGICGLCGHDGGHKTICPLNVIK